jgi:hypothetical protein
MVELSRRTVLAVLGTCMLVCGGVKAAEPETAGAKTKTPNQLWVEAVELFDNGDFVLAKVKLDVLVPSINENMAKKLVDKAGLATMIRLLASDKIGRGPKVIWELYSKYSRKKLIDDEHINKFVNIAIDDKSNEVTRAKALHELFRIGQYAVPVLASQINSKSAERLALIRIALTRIGHRGTLAVLKLMNTGNDTMKATLALALSDITPSDTRAIPVLKRLYDNPKVDPTLKKVLARALEKISGLKPQDMGIAADYYYLLADRYYMEKSGVPEEALESDGVIWELDKKGKLKRRSVPVYAWNEEIAEDILYECLASYPTYDRAFPLLISLQLAQRVEVELIGDVIKANGRPATMTENDESLLSERGSLLADARLLAQTAGPRYLYRAVGKALRNGRGDVAAATIDLIPESDPDGSLLPPVRFVSKDDAKTKKRRRRKKVKKVVAPEEKSAKLLFPGLPEFDGQSLVDALSSGNDAVRISAAIALAKINPAKPFPGSKLVVSALADAISKGGPMQILFVEDNDDLFKALKPKVLEHGFGIDRCTGSRDALSSALGFPPKDLILISANLKDPKAKKGETGEDGVWLMKRIKADSRLAGIPVAVVTVKKNVKAAQAAFGDIPVITRSTSVLDLKVDLEAALGEVGIGITKQKRELMAARSARALLEIDPLRTFLNVSDASASCTKALVNRPDAVRNPCVRALGLFRVKAAAPAILVVFKQTKNTDELRTNCLYALGQTDAVAHRELFVKAVGEEKAFSLRQAAAIAAGKAQVAPKPKTIFDALKAIRLTRTSSGGDGRPDKHKVAAPVKGAAVEGAKEDATKKKVVEEVDEEL